MINLAEFFTRGYIKNSISRKKRKMKIKRTQNKILIIKSLRIYYFTLRPLREK